MVQQITKGIKISVTPNFEGTLHRNNILYYNFSYEIKIENNSFDTVKLQRRHWEIIDSLNFTEIVEGIGVVGETPTIQLHEFYTYKSQVFLQSSMGVMTGFFTMRNIANGKEFKVIVPTFYLITPEVLN